MRFGKPMPTLVPMWSELSGTADSITTDVVAALSFAMRSGK